MPDRAEILPTITSKAVAIAGAPAVFALGALAGLRRARGFHPLGVALTGTWTAADETLDPLVPARPWPVIVRLSKGVGLPGRLPDVLGLAVRLVDLSGPDAHQDLLFASSGAGGLAQRVIRPTADHGHADYSSVTSYRTPLGTGVLWARARLDDHVRSPVTLEEAASAALDGQLHHDVGVSVGDRSQLLGELWLHERLSPAENESLRFDPTNHVDDLRPVGVFDDLRKLAYGVSQWARPIPTADAGEVVEHATQQEATGVHA